MKTIYKYPIKDSNETVLVEIEAEGGQMVKASRAGTDAKLATGNLDEAFAKLQPMMPALAATLKSFVTDGQGSQISFGVKLTYDGDALITSGQGDANFIVTVSQS